MHEVGLAGEIVDRLIEIMDENNLTEIKSVTLRIGEATAVVPQYMLDCWPAVTEGTRIAKSELKIEKVTALGRCHECEEVFPILENHNRCPKCGCEDYDMMTGFEYEISDILAR